LTVHDEPLEQKRTTFRGGVALMAAVASRVAGSDERDVEGVRCARTQALMREVNEQIHTLGRRLGREWCEVVCECAGAECLRPIMAGSAEYESVRRFPSRFLVAPGHEDLDFERVVEDHGAYVVVEKIGVGASAAIELDSRRARRSNGNG
jgi:hypothetical protein